MHTYTVKRPPRCVREIGNDDGGMTDDRHHRMFLVDTALPNVLAWMRVHIRENLQLLVPAVAPKRGIAVCMERDPAKMMSTWVEIIITDIRHRPSGNIVLTAKQKGPAFNLAPTTATQIENDSSPKQNAKRDRDDCRIRRQGNLRSGVRNGILPGSLQSYGYSSRQGVAVAWPNLDDLERPHDHRDDRKPCRFPNLS